jgi:hypothetical protein
MKLQPLGYALLGCLLVPAGAASAAELPGDYFKLLAAEVKAIESDASLKSNPGAMLAAAVLYTKQHAANPSFSDKKKLDLALALGDLYAGQAEKDTADNKQDYEWEIHFWLDTYRLLDKELGPERRARWKREIDKIVRWFAVQVEGRLDFPRYQGPYIHTSTNHLSIFASTVYLAGRVLANKEWETLGARALHRLAAEEQTADGYWGEFTDNGPAAGYNYLTMCSVALYYEHSQDKAALEALRRATDFHKHFTWPDGTPVETINGRNRHWGVSAWGHFGFTHWPDGRRYAAFLADFFMAGKLASRNLGRIAQSALYYHEGATAPIPQEQARFAYQMKVNAGIRKTGPWTVCLSGLIDTPIDSQFTLDRQSHVSIYHEKLGLIVTGANSKRQPELATFLDKSKDRITTIPLSSRLRMSPSPLPSPAGGEGTDKGDRLGLGYSTFFAEAEVPTPTAERMPFRFAITETAPNRLQDAQLNLQLCLKAGEALETAKTKIALDEKRIELGPEEIGGWIRHHGWTLRVDPAARLVWPVLPFNPYRNAPETELRYAVGVLSVPVKVAPPAEGAFKWRRGAIAFALEANTADKGDKAVPTELAKLAQSMKPGAWAELKTEGYTADLLKVQNHHILEYTDTAVWDPKSEQVLFVGQGHYSALKFITYSAANNTWKLMPTPPWWKGDPQTGKGPIGHAYNNNAIDPVKSILYHHQSATRLVHQYDITKGEWSTLPEIKDAATGHGSAIAYFPEMKGLVRVYGGAVHFFDEEKKTWSLLKEKLAMGPYHNIAKYNSVDKSVILGAGNNSKELYRLDAKGTITALKEAPFVIRISSTVVAADPVSGNILALNMEAKNKFYALDLKKNEWRQLADAPINEGVAVPIDAHGVTMFLLNRPTKVYLYKHAAPGAAD